MQIVIDIPYDLYKTVISDYWCGDNTFRQAVINGTPLPEGHGRLIDADAIDWFKGEDENGNPCYILDKRDLSLEPTVLEADRR